MIHGHKKTQAPECWVKQCASAAQAQKAMGDTYTQAKVGNRCNELVWRDDGLDILVHS